MRRAFLWLRRGITVESLTGFGTGLVLAALLIAPADDSKRNTYAWLAIVCGVSIFAGAKTYEWIVRRKSIAASRQDNLAGLHQSIKN